MGGDINLVTGGAGFLGRHLVRLLSERGEAVRVLDLTAPEPPPAGVEWVRGDILDRDALDRAFAGVGRVYHLAANPNLWAVDKQVFERVNHEGTRRVLEAAVRAGVERLVHTSTESILAGGRRPGDPPMDGARLPELARMPGPYCRSKYLAERAALDAARAGLPVVVVSPTCPVGPGDVNLTPPSRMLLDFFNRRIPAYLDCGLNLVDVRDAAQGHVLAAERGRVGERYVLGGENLMLSELLGLLAEISAKRMPALRIPYSLALAVAWVSEWLADHVTHRPPRAPLTGVRLAAAPLFFDSTKALEELGWTRRPLRRSLAEALAWFERQGLVNNGART